MKHIARELITIAKELTANLTDEKAVDLVKKQDQLLYKLQTHMDNIVEGLENADDQIKGLQRGGGGIIDASVILRKNVSDRVEALRNFCNAVLKQLE